jgi:hypothetical protein
LVWDAGNRDRIGRYGVTQEDIDGMLASGEWVTVRHPTRSGQLILIGRAGGDAERQLIACVVEPRETAQGRRFRPIIARPAAAWHRQAWQDRYRREESLR